MRVLPEPLFSLYALSLPRGHGFGTRPPVGAWTTEDERSCGVIVSGGENDFGVMLMRRRVDDVWVVKEQIDDLSAFSKAHSLLSSLMIEDAPPEPIPRGVPRRAALHDLKGRAASDVFKLLAARTHHQAARMLYHLYMALPKPDENWVSDCQTGNFHTRLWEAILLGALREQGHLVTQPHESPDFRVENRHGGVAWIEAVTANPQVPYNHVGAPQAKPPDDPQDIFSGAMALRFAKTLGNKLQRRYDQLPHVAGQPFMIAVADFHAAGSMKWSREALIGYLYGQGAKAVEVGGIKQPCSVSFTHLEGPSQFPAGLFANDQCSELSAIVFSNACTLGKLNRVGITTLGAPAGLRYMRVGMLFDRAPGAVVGRPFCLDVMSEEYRQLWPGGREPWSAELEVFHNPFALHPVSRLLLPECTHWFKDADGDIKCKAFYENQVLWSQTVILDACKPPITLEHFSNHRDGVAVDDA